MITRRHVLSGATLLAGGLGLLRGRTANAQAAPTGASDRADTHTHGPYTPVVTPNGTTMPWTMKDGVKEFRIVAEPMKREFAPGMVVDCWGYNGMSPGPTIEVVEGDRVRLFVTNKLPERTSMHWHGVLLPNGMDGVAGLVQPHILPGETYVYEFTLRQHGTLLYHPHSDEMVQMALGMMGFFIVHPRAAPRVDRDFAIMLHEWAIPPGTSRPNPSVMTDFNIFTFNSRVWPGTDPLVIRQGDRVRVRLGNLSMDNHPIHIHGHRFEVTGTDGGPIPVSARHRENTVDVPVGATRDFEFVADEPGDWPLHCHKSHHTMNAMSHDLPNVIGVQPSAEDAKLREILPGYMAMGTTGMGDMMSMGGPRNTLPMMSGKGPFGDIEMGGMFTVMKIRRGLTSYADPGWYAQPEGTRARKV
jgi:FtsP/CotA-like multicopper oxidase with cupredoxin domain